MVKGCSDEGRTLTSQTSREEPCKGLPGRMADADWEGPGEGRDFYGGESLGGRGCGEGL